MKPATLKTWGLKEAPFVNDITNIKFFYEGEKYAETIRRMIGGVKENNTDITLITGEVGTGKSFTSVMIFSDLRELGYEVVYVENSYDNYETLMCKIVRDMSTSKPTNITEADLCFDDILNDLAQENKQLVLILDECHGYDNQTLDKIRQLSNRNSKSPKKLISLILVGQTEIMIKLRDMKQLNSRIKERQYLEFLKVDEIDDYIDFKMRKAGFAKRKPNPFTGFAREIHNGTLGMPRLINNVCEAALEISAEKNEKELTLETIEKAIAEKCGSEMFE